MKTKWFTGAAAASAGLCMLAISASAANAASLTNCLHSAKDVRAAMAQNQNSPKLEEAQRQQRYGLEFCNRGFYDKGVAHYAMALKMLGAESKS